MQAGAQPAAFAESVVESAALRWAVRHVRGCGLNAALRDMLLPKLVAGELRVAAARNPDKGLAVQSTSESM